jgi:hypothetical protein
MKEMKEMEKAKMVEDMNENMEFKIPNEMTLKYNEWLDNPTPIRVIEVQRVLKTGSWLVIGTNDENENVVYKIYFPSYFNFFQKVKEKVENGYSGNLIMSFSFEENKIRFDDDLPF